MRHIGIILMAMAFTHYLTRNSTDKGTEINLLWSRTVVNVHLSSFLVQELFNELKASIFRFFPNNLYLFELTCTLSIQMWKKFLASMFVIYTIQYTHNKSMSGKTSHHGLDLFLEKGHMSVELHYNVYPIYMYNNILHRFCSLVLFSCVGQCSF